MQFGVRAVMHSNPHTIHPNIQPFTTIPRWGTHPHCHKRQSGLHGLIKHQAIDSPSPAALPPIPVSSCELHRALRCYCEQPAQHPPPRARNQQTHPRMHAGPLRPNHFSYQNCLVARYRQQKARASESWPAHSIHPIYNVRESPHPVYLLPQSIQCMQHTHKLLSHKASTYTTNMQAFTWLHKGNEVDKRAGGENMHAQGAHTTCTVYPTCPPAGSSPLE